MARKRRPDQCCLEKEVSFFECLKGCPSSPLGLPFARKNMQRATDDEEQDAATLKSSISDFSCLAQCSMQAWMSKLMGCSSTHHEGPLAMVSEPAHERFYARLLGIGPELFPDLLGENHFQCARKGTPMELRLGSSPI